MTEITDLSPTDASNTEITGESLDGNIANMGRMDNTLQAILGMFGRWTSSDTIASSGTCDIGAQPEAYLTVSGTTTITSFGTVRAGTIRFLRFSGILTLTHNGTSLILPGAANITTAAGDTAIFVSEGSGNWRCLSYQVASSIPYNNATRSFVKVASQTASNSASLDFENASLFDGTYSKILFVMESLIPATDSDSMWVRAKVGGSYVAANYGYNVQSLRSDTTTFITSAGTASANMIIGVGLGNASGEAFSGELNVYDPANAAVYKQFIWSTAFFNAQAIFENGTGFGGYNGGVGALEGVRFMMSSGNITSGTITVYGLLA